MNISYKSDNGYSGILSGEVLSVVNEKGDVVFHTYFSSVHNEKELKEYVEQFPKFLAVLRG